nr:hypothetical protein [uncultured Sellimonas sp.]
MNALERGHGTALAMDPDLTVRGICWVDRHKKEYIANHKRCN